MHPLLLTAAVLFATTPAAIPGANDPDAYTQRNYLEDRLRFNRATMSAAYLESGSRDPAWDEQAVWLLDSQALSFSNYGIAHRFHTNHADGEEMKRVAERLLEQGCDDPLVLYVMMRQLDDDDERRVELAVRAAEGLATSEYSLNRKVAAARWAWQLLDETEWVAETQQARQTYVDLLVELLTNPPDVEGNPAAWRIILPNESDMEKLGVETWKQIVNRADREAGEDRWLADVAAGMYRVEAAWDARGNGWASTVSDKGWRDFEKHLRVAAKHFTRAWEAHPELPESASEMITVAMGLQTGQERTWFDRAAAAQFDYKPAYSAYRWSIRPRWGGSLEQLHTFGTECLETERFDTDIPNQFFTAMDNIADDSDGYGYWSRPGIYEQFVRLQDGRIAAVEEPASKDWHRTIKAAIAWRVGRYDEARAIVDDLGNGIQPEAFEWVDGNRKLSVSEIYARTTPQTRLMVGTAEQKRDRGDDVGAIALLLNARDEIDGPNPARDYLDDLYVTTLWQHQDRQGQWLELIGHEAGFAGWDSLRGEWNIDEQGRLVGRPTKQGLIAQSRYDLGRRYELRGTLTLLESPYNRINAALLFDLRPHKKHFHHRDVIFVRSETSNITLANDFKKDRQIIPSDLDQTVEFMVQRWDDIIRIEIDGEVVADRANLPGKAREDTYPLGIGGHYWYDKPVIRFDRLEARRLSAQPNWAR